MGSLSIEQSIYPGTTGYFSTRGSLSLVGNLMAVGEPGNDTGGTDRGIVRVYTRNALTGLYALTASFQSPAPETGECFGNSTALLVDPTVGTWLFVGAPYRDNGGTNRGSLFAYQLVGGVWQAPQEIVGALDHGYLGFSVVVNASWLMIGSPGKDKYNGGTFVGTVEAYVPVVGVWTYDQTLSGSLGGSSGYGRAIALDGETIVIGAYVATAGATGRVYVNTLVGGTWTEQQILAPFSGGAWNFYGAEVALTGNTIAVGETSAGDFASPAGGSVEVWKRSGVVWTRTGHFAPSGTSRDCHVGAALAVTADEQRVYVSRPGVGGALILTGEVFVFDLIGGVWTETAVTYESQVAPGINDGFASSIMLLESGSTTILAIGQTNVGGSGTDGAVALWSSLFFDDNCTVPIGTCYVDHLEYLNPGASVDGEVINRIPDGAETDVYRYGPVYFQAVAYQNADLSGDLTVTITPASTGVPVLVYDQAAGGFQTGYTGTATVRQSPGAAVDDELVISFVPDVAFASLDLILVEVSGGIDGFSALSASYSFTVEDYTAPDIEDILWLTPQYCRVKFNEPMDVTGEHTSSLFYRYYKGGVTVLDASTILLPGASLSADWVGLYFGLAGSAYPCNNGFHEITAIDVSARQITVSSTLKADNGLDYNSANILADRRSLYGAITPYVFTARLSEEGAGTETVSAERVQCTYLPIVIKVEEVPASDLPSGADPEQYVYLTTFDDISINRLYTIAGYHAEDKWENAMNGESLDWTAPAFEHPDNRMSLWHPGLIPTPDQQDDLIEGTGQLRKMAVVLNDALNQLWYRNLMVQYTNDPFRCPEHLLDDLLYDLASPFLFPLTTPMLKRKLAWALPELYKRVGTRRGIKDAIYKVLGILCTIQTYLHQDAWILGTSKLGTETILAPSTTFMKNCYEILAPRALTDAEVRIIRDIAQWADPPVMHLVRIVENIAGGATHAVTYVSEYQTNTSP